MSSKRVAGEQVRCAVVNVFCFQQQVGDGGRFADRIERRNAAFVQNGRDVARFKNRSEL